MKIEQMNFTKRLATGLMAAVLSLGGAAVPAFASMVYLVGDSNVATSEAIALGDNEIFFENVFGGKNLANFSDRTFGGFTTANETNFGSGTAVNAANLAGADFLVFGYNNTSVSAAELSAITNFANSGGSLFLIGEGNTSFANVNATVNSVLSAVGSTMSMSTTDNFDLGAGSPPTYENIGSFTASGAETTGVNSWATAFAGSINVGSGSALISGVGDVGNFGVAVAGEALAPIPLPAALPLMSAALGLLGLLGIRRRRQVV